MGTGLGVAGDHPLKAEAVEIRPSHILWFLVSIHIASSTTTAKHNSSTMRSLLQLQQRVPTSVNRHHVQTPVSVNSARCAAVHRERAAKRQRTRAAAAPEGHPHADACSTSYAANKDDWDVDHFMQLLRQRRQQGEAWLGMQQSVACTAAHANFRSGLHGGWQGP